jgi:hypothetical protein
MYTLPPLLSSPCPHPFPLHPSELGWKLPTTLANHNRYVTTWGQRVPSAEALLPLIQCKTASTREDSLVQSDPDHLSPVRSSSIKQGAMRVCVAVVPTESSFLRRPGSTTSSQHSTRATCHILNTGSAWQRGGDAVRSQSTSAARSRHGLGASLKQVAHSSQMVVGVWKTPRKPPELPAGADSALRCWVFFSAARSSQGSASTVPVPLTQLPSIKPARLSGWQRAELRAE